MLNYHGAGEFDIMIFDNTKVGKNVIANIAGSGKNLYIHYKA